MMSKAAVRALARRARVGVPYYNPEFRRFAARGTVLGLGIAVAALGSVWNLWSAAAPLSDATLKAGELGLELGPLTWTSGDGTGSEPGDYDRTDAGLADAGLADAALGDHEDATARPVTIPGGQARLTQVLTTHLRGNNTVADLAVRFVDADPESARVSAGYFLADEAGTRVVPSVGDVPLGMPLSLTGLRPNGDGATTWQVVVTVWDNGPLGSPAAQWQPGRLEIELTQRRIGAAEVWRTERAVTFPAVTLQSSQVSPHLLHLIDNPPIGVPVIEPEER